MRKLIGSIVWRICWQSFISRWRWAQDIGTIVWVWGYGGSGNHIPSVRKMVSQVTTEGVINNDEDNSH